MSNSILLSFLTSIFLNSACKNENQKYDTSGADCFNSDVFSCEDDQFFTGQMIVSVQVPDWDEEYDSVSVRLERLDDFPLEGILHTTDTECGTLWEAEFRLFNVTCGEITTKEVTKVLLLNDKFSY